MIHNLIKAVEQLLQLLKKFNQGWTPDWEDNETIKYCISGFGNGFSVYEFRYQRVFLAFETEEKANEFLELHRELIKQAKPFI